MATVLLLPLDERPCNLKFPSLMSEGISDVDILTPPPGILGRKKQAGDTDAIAHWLMENLGRCDAAVLSIDMLLYGGIVPSRLHDLSLETCLNRLSLLRDIRRTFPKLKLYAFNLIMRTPAYSSSEEEPDYYAQFGRAIFECGWYTDKSSQGPLTPQEQELWQKAKQGMPEAVLFDYTDRRQVNHAVNLAAVELVRENVLDFLVIPLDDCAQYGWSPSEQRALRHKITANHLGNRVYSYSGADEVGSALTARAVNTMRGTMPRVWVRYSATQGPLIIPKYEDRFFGESLKWQIIAAGGLPCDTAEQADWILMANAPTIGGERMGEAPQAAEQLDASYYSARCLPEFALTMKEWMHKKPVALTDAAMANGADDELMSMLEAEGILGQLVAYAGWNTSANATGTCIAHAMIRANAAPAENRFLNMRLLEDWAYMTHVRQMALKKIMMMGGGYFNLNGQEAVLSDYVRTELNTFMNNRLGFMRNQWSVEDVSFPWARLFEIDFDLIKRSFQEESV